jgi:hypothetical protein
MCLVSTRLLLELLWTSSAQAQPACHVTQETQQYKFLEHERIKAQHAALVDTATCGTRQYQNTPGLSPWPNASESGAFSVPASEHVCPATRTPPPR